MATLTLNELFYERYIKSDFYLRAISYNENSLYVEADGKTIKQVFFNSHDDLAKIPVESFKIREPYFFLDVLEINNQCEQSLNTEAIENEDLSKTIQLDRLYLPIRFILVKNQTSEEEDKTVMEFLFTYNRLVNANGYLTASSNAVFKQMSSILNWILEPRNIKPQNNSQLIIKEYIQSLNNGTHNQFISAFNQGNSGLEKGTPLTRTNPNAPSTIDDKYNMEKAGFLSFFALLYVAFNLIVALVILTIRK